MSGVLNADTALWRFLEIRRRLDSVGGPPLIDGRGLTFGARCRRCRAPQEQARIEELDVVTRASAWVCSSCDEPWPVNVAFLVRGGVQLPRRGTNGAGPERRFELASEADRIRGALEGLTQRQQLVYLLLHTYEGLSYAAIPDQMRARFPAVGPEQGARGPRASGWSEWTARRCCAEARARLSQALREGGLRGRLGAG